MSKKNEKKVAAVPPKKRTKKVETEHQRVTAMLDAAVAEANPTTVPGKAPRIRIIDESTGSDEMLKAARAAIATLSAPVPVEAPAPAVALVPAPAPAPVKAKKEKPAPKKKAEPAPVELTPAQLADGARMISILRKTEMRKTLQDAIGLSKSEFRQVKLAEVRTPKASYEKVRRYFESRPKEEVVSGSLSVRASAANASPRAVAAPPDLIARARAAGQLDMFISMLESRLK